MAVSIGVVDDVCVSATLELLCHLNLAHREKKLLNQNSNVVLWLGFCYYKSQLCFGV